MMARHPQGQGRRGDAAFTLVEIALALGVTAFALVGILGMVPVAVETAREARNETLATFIASSIVETIRTGEPGVGMIQREPDVAMAGAFELVDLPPPAVVTRDLGYDADGILLGRMPGYSYTSGTGANAGAVFLARIILTPAGAMTPPRLDGMTKVEVRVETPIAAAAGNRSHYSFVSLVAP